MSKGTEKSSFFEKLATVIVDKRNLIFFLYACALIFCLFSRNWVSVCNDITEYLPETTETRQGLTLMEEEFTTFGTARVMVSHVTYEIAEELAEQMEQIEGVTSATFGSSTVGADTGGDGEPETPEDITEYFKGADALISVTFDGEEEDEISLAALAAIRELLEPYDGRMIVELLWGLFETTARLEDAQDRAAMHKLALLMAESLNLDSWIAECGPSKI